MLLFFLFLSPLVHCIRLYFCPLSATTGSKPLSPRRRREFSRYRTTGTQRPVYRFYLVDFPRKDILGLSLGENQIFLSYELTRRGFDQTGYLWLFRHTLAHEIAHHALRHGQNEHAASLNAVPRSAAQISGRDLGLPPAISLRNYSRESELAADRKALDYWRQLGWDCRIWVAIFKSFLDEGYMGDVHHPTEERLSEALRSCPAAAHKNFKKFAGEGAG